LLTQLFFGLIKVMVFTAFCEAGAGTLPIGLPHILTYIWLSQAFYAVLPFSPEQEVRQAVRSGSVVYELLKPLDLYWLWFSRALASKLAPTIMRSLPLLVVALFFLDLNAPASWAAFLCFLVTLGGAFVLSAAIINIMNLSILFTLSGDGAARLVMTLAMIFSGIIVPLPLFPDWCQGFIRLLPFRGLMDVPFRFYCGNLPPGDFLSELLLQWAWIGILILVGQVLAQLGAKRLIVHGG
jgi:ABC-2 type transport system permease protein